MGRYVGCIEYRSQMILLSNYSGLKGAEYEAAVEKTIAEPPKLTDGITAPSISAIKCTAPYPG